MLHVQTLEEAAEGIAKEALYLNEVIGKNLYVKVPVTNNGIKEIQLLKNQGIKTPATTINTLV